MKKNKQVVGRIIVVQEERFRLLDELGRSYLLNLSHNSDATNEELQEWNKAKTRLIVEYEGEPEEESGVAHSVRAAVS